MSASLALPATSSIASTNKPASSGHLGALDLARGLAALAVALYHFSNNGFLPKDHWFAAAGWYGHLGVRAFFVMSGFVVPFAMWRGGYTGRGFFNFMGRRLARLYPPYAVSVVIAAITALVLGTPVSFTSLAAHVFYLNDLIGVPWLMEVFWTLAIEVQFYVVIALVWRVAAIPRSWPFVALALAVLGVCYLPCPERSLPHYGAYFLLGIAAFRWHGDIGSRFANAAVTAMAVAAITSRDGTASGIASLLPLALLVLPIPVPRWGRFLGEVSYSLYLCHLATGAAFLMFMETLSVGLAFRPVLVLVALAISIATAWLGYRWIESPAMRWAKRFGYRNEASRVPGVPAVERRVKSDARSLGRQSQVA